MTVAELIEHLKNFPSDLQVVTRGEFYTYGISEPEIKNIEEIEKSRLAGCEPGLALFL